jgi:hypothetical protein
MAPTLGDYIIFFHRLFFLSCTVIRNKTLRKEAAEADDVGQACSEYRKYKRYFSAAHREHNPDNALGASPFPALADAPRPRRWPLPQRAAAARAAARRKALRGNAPPGQAIEERFG